MRSSRMAHSALLILLLVSLMPAAAGAARLGAFRAEEVQAVALNVIAAPPGCCDPCVTYRHALCSRVCCDPCLPNIKTCVTVCHPCTGCKVEIPVCLPGCCTGCPERCDRCTVIGHGATTFTWCCGYSVTVRYQRCGDFAVIYRG